MPRFTNLPQKLLPGVMSASYIGWQQEGLAMKRGLEMGGKSEGKRGFSVDHVAGLAGGASAHRRGGKSVRRCQGQAIAEGSAMLVIFLPIMIGVIFFVCDLGMSLVYDQKMSYLSAQAATYYASRIHGWNYQNKSGPIELDDFVQRLGDAMGLPRNCLSTSVTENKTTHIAVITVTGKNLPLLKGSFLPGIISVHESCAADPNIMPRPTGLLSICVTGQQPYGHTPYEPTVLVPCYSGCFSSDVTKWDKYRPNIPGPGHYDQFSFSAPASVGACMTHTPGDRGRTP